VLGLTHPPFGWSLGADERHVAALLQEAGYETALFGFQHVATDETTLGFEHRFSDGSALAARVCSDLESYVRDRDDPRPQYLEINIEEPHRPFGQGGAVPDRTRGVFVPPYLPGGSASEQEMAELQGAIRQADAGIGSILRVIDEAGVSANTMVVFVADHGLAMPRAKGTLYDPGIEVACIIRWPGRVQAGTRNDDLVSHIDVLPTLLEAVGIESPRNIQGVSFLESLTGERPASVQGRTHGPGSGRHVRGEIFAEKTYHSYYDPMRALRTRTHKLIVNFDTAFAVEVPGDVEDGAIFRSNPSLYHGRPHLTTELYDLNSDPLEQVNLAGQPDTESIEYDLRSRLKAWMQETGDPLLDGPVASPGWARAAEWLRGSPGSDSGHVPC